MAEPSSSASAETRTTAAPAGSNPIQSEPDSQNKQPDSSLPQQSPPYPNTNPNTTTPPPPATLLIAPPSIQPYASSAGAVVPPTAPSFRPATTAIPQFSPVPLNHSYQTPAGVQPPGVSTVPQLHGMLPRPPSVTGTGQVPVASSVPTVIPPLPYAPPGQPIRAPYAPLPNGYPAISYPAPHGVIPPPGILRYPSPYAPMTRPAYPQRPLAAVGVIPPLSRPPLAGLRAPVVPLVIRPPVVPSVASTEKQTTVYVGKMASTVENDFIFSLLQLCGPVKSWNRPQNPTDGTFKGFGFCEFESAEGVLRALRLLSKLNIDGQELMLNVNQATRDYLENFVLKKLESSKNLKETETESAKTDGVVSADKNNEAPKPSMESPKPAAEDSEKGDFDAKNKENSHTSSFGLVTEEDRQGDQEALEKLTGLIEERLKNLPPPPAQIAADGSSNSDLEGSARSKDGEDAVTTKDAVEDKNENEMTSESKPSGEQDRSETSSPDRDRKHDRRSKDRDRELKREKERELERYEREREQERAKREKEREYRIRDDERRFKAREKEWEAREKEREHWRKREREREKNRAQDRKSEIANQEHESDDGYSKKRKYRNSEEERRRQREKEDDLADRLKEEEEVAGAKRMSEEEQKKRQQEEELRLLSGNGPNGSDGGVLPEENNLGSKDKAVEQTSDHDLSMSNYIGDGNVKNGIADRSLMASLSANDARQNSSAPARKLGFGLQGSGKRTTVPSVFDQDEDEDMRKEKKMRPLVPIDYSTEEQLAIQSSISESPPSNLVAATESARRISNINPKHERADLEKERSRKSHDRSSQRDRDRNGDEVTRTRDENRKESLDRVREPGIDKGKAPDNQKLVDAKQLIDMIPKTKDELFSYEINWATYDKNALHEKMRPWISKKIREFLGEEEPSLVEYIMSSTREHVEAAEMLNRLQGILDEEAEMFVLKMWRMLIFEIKRVETGLALRSRT